MATNIDDPFAGVWSVVHCPDCNALFPKSTCPVCGHVLDLTPARYVIDGVEHLLPAVQQGAIPWSVHVLLRQMRREWERPLVDAQQGASPEKGQKLVIVILFWTLVEILMDRFYESAFADLPGDIGKELLSRFPSVGGRMDRLYKRRWGVTFWDDLSDLGFAVEATHLRHAQAARNAFVHGDPEAITDELIEATIVNLRRTQLGWIEVFNRRCSKMTNRVPIWNADLRTRT